MLEYKTAPICVNFALKSRFETLNDKTLVLMLEEALRYIYDAKTKGAKKGRWLTYAGKSGTGKTYLATKIYNYCGRNLKCGFKITGETHKFLDFYSITSSQLADNFRACGYDDYANKADMLYIDDLGAEKDTTGYVKGKMCELLSRRVGKWTLITSNLSLESLGESYDNRIASRIIRDENVLVSIKDVQDYALRKMQNQK